MKKSNKIVKLISLLMISSVLLVSCSSTTQFRTNPKGAKILIDGVPVGYTPYTHTDSKVVTSKMRITLKKEGYETLSTSVSKDEEVNIPAIVGGLCCFFPYIWAMGYKPVHYYELEPVKDSKKATIMKKELKSTVKNDINASNIIN